MTTEVVIVVMLLLLLLLLHVVVLPGHEQRVVDRLQCSLRIQLRLVDLLVARDLRQNLR